MTSRDVLHWTSNGFYFFIIIHVTKIGWYFVYQYTANTECHGVYSCIWGENQGMLFFLMFCFFRANIYRSAGKCQE